jgi:hypothetical protein
VGGDVGGYERLTAQFDGAIRHGRIRADRIFYLSIFFERKWIKSSSMS